MGTNIRRAAAGSCSLPTVLKSCQELLQKGSRKRRPKTHYFIRLSYGPKLYVNRPLHKRRLTIELHFSVAGYGGLHLPFSGITQYLRGLVFVYERPIIAGVRTSITSSTTRVCNFLPGVVAPETHRNACSYSVRELKL